MSRVDPFALNPMNNVFPPTWETVSGGEHPDPYNPDLDEGTQLRHTNGNDKVNYFTRQRVEGDLFKRDCVLQKSLIGVSDYLAARSGITLSQASVALPPGTSISFGSITSTDEIAGYWVVGFSINIRDPLTGWANNEVRLEVLNNVNGDVLFAANPTSRRTQVWTVSQNSINGFRGPFVTVDSEARISNESSVRLVISASVILAPCMNLNPDDTGDTDPGLLLLDDSVSGLFLDDSESRLILD